MKYFAKIIYRAVIVVFLLFGSSYVFAEGPRKPSEMNNTLAIVMVVIAGVLLIAIVTLAHVLTGVAEVYMQRLKEEKKKAAGAAKILSLLLFCGLSVTAFAQDNTVTEAAPQAVTSIGGLSVFSFYALAGVIATELVVILVMIYYINLFVKKEKAITTPETAVEKKFDWKKLWQKMNNFKSAREEEALVLNHNYDGIKELDNSLPRWWVYGFYLTILFGVVYVYRFHISHTGQLPAEELQVALTKAAEQKEAFLKKSADKVDENTVALNADPAYVEEGHKLFTGNCAPCHGDKGQGVVGPNLTDDYWLHKGGVKDIFKTIKYGYPEKGMKAWQDDFSPAQIAKISNYIITLKGTHPPGAKEPQGDLYIEENAAADTTAAPAVKPVDISKR
ncbi:cbb3-type cytochrome c oxidase N-terminal domain-containing protein [Foetidibacter luteolus]|uniref:cbb3-type cytochrome c oxidase N-terminal domain-containing protein n=1 Tax=Foetidibacter luteolus TaxID=2608880 RepID=UPI00129AAC11|nr:cbb3-type cytochrome c oxidase N-terminal domain-containing protein [Foetidibacter luteolus]